MSSLPASRHHDMSHRHTVQTATTPSAAPTVPPGPQSRTPMADPDRKGRHMDALDPFFQRELLRDRLKRAREQAGLTQREVATALDWSPSKVIRIENGKNRVSPSDVRILIQHYGAGQEEQETLIAMGRAARLPSWWEPWRTVATPNFLTYLTYETSAPIIRNFEPNLIPGLLQTEEYASHLLKGLEETQDKAEALLQLRLERQARVLRPDGPSMWFIIDESALRRTVGNEAVMRRQLENLVQLNEAENVHIMYVPFSAGIYPLFRSPYVVFEFPEQDYDLVSYVESPDGEVLFSEKAPGRSGQRAPSDYLEAFWETEREAARELPARILDLPAV
ncbi:Scr1 family TA system antitoxin-like transcriptional regulator [Streptomyces fructofermentans]|uniref:helix-turn-helix domain-containing protein n=1 Tax=Streptomyces fructofermentans TaxID=152141 RepID=UPI0034043879